MADVRRLRVSCRLMILYFIVFVHFYSVSHSLSLSEALPRACFAHFGRKFLNDLSKILMTIVFSYCFYTLYFLYAHLHPIFLFLHLTFYSRNSKYYIHLLFFLISSLHTFVHHCTFCASLHVKTSLGAPDRSIDTVLEFTRQSATGNCK